MGEDAFWRAVRRLVYDTVAPEKLEAPIAARLRTTDEFLAIASDEAGEDLAWFFEVYARRGPLPRLDVVQMSFGVMLKWTDVDDLDFPMPIPVRVNDELQRVEFADNEAFLASVRVADILIDPHMEVLRKLPIVPTCEERRDGEATPAR